VAAAYAVVLGCLAERFFRWEQRGQPEVSQMAHSDSQAGATGSSAPGSFTGKLAVVTGGGSGGPREHQGSSGNAPRRHEGAGRNPARRNSLARAGYPGQTVTALAATSPPSLYPSAAA
jgi:hypothetical protein